MKKNILTPEVIKERIERIKKSNNPILIKLKEIIEKNNKLNTLNK